MYRKIINLNDLIKCECVQVSVILFIKTIVWNVFFFKKQKVDHVSRVKIYLKYHCGFICIICICC
jgi:hypothetical protein